MMTITPEQARAIKRKQADKNLNIEQVAREIGISFITYKRIIKGEYSTKPTVYAKAMEWLAKDY